MKAILAVLLSTVTLWAVAQGTQGYVTDGSGQIVKTGTGLCLRNGSWTPADANAECDGGKPAVVAAKANLRADVLFGFDKAELTAEGRAALDRVAAAIDTSGVVVVTGYTDQIGTAAYNQKLSERRAQAVAKYLATKTNARFQVAGMGSKSPLPGTELCAGMRKWDRKVACYAPNRRVEVDFLTSK